MEEIRESDFLMAQSKFNTAGLKWAAIWQCTYISGHVFLLAEYRFVTIKLCVELLQILFDSLLVWLTAGISTRNHPKSTRRPRIILVETCTANLLCEYFLAYEPQGRWVEVGHLGRYGLLEYCVFFEASWDQPGCTLV